MFDPEKDRWRSASLVRMTERFKSAFRNHGPEDERLSHCSDKAASAGSTPAGSTISFDAGK